MIYLYVKTHLKTGMKYLGQTKSKNPCTYQGSGLYWQRHVKYHGYNVDTMILKECNTYNEVKDWGLYYSDLWDIVNSPDWANLKKEDGRGGDPGPSGRKKISKKLKGRQSPFKGKTFDEIYGVERATKMRKKISDNQLGKKQSLETISKRVEKNQGQKRNKEQLKNLSQGQINRDPHSLETKQKQSISALKSWKNGKVHGRKGKKFGPTATSKYWLIYSIDKKYSIVVYSLRSWCLVNTLSYQTAHAYFKQGKIYKGYIFSSID